MTFLVAGDWHLSPESRPLDARLALAFLARARAGREVIVLNGDVFDDLFAGARRAQGAHPQVVAAIDALAREGRLLRARGNHDPEGGEARIVLDVSGIGRVLVAHGHDVDPVHASPLGRLGDAISRRLGRRAAVRAAARLAERAARALAEERMEGLFRRRCLREIRREGCGLGVFGHLHVPHVVPGDPYVNAGGLLGGALSYVALDRSGPRLLRLREEDLRRGDGFTPEMG